MSYKHSYAQKRFAKKQKEGYHRSKSDEPSKCSLTYLDRARRHGLYIPRRYYGEYLPEVKYPYGLRGTGESLKVIVLKVTNPHKDTMPYEHLSLNRIDFILY